ncbi:MAG: hypothetical protein ACE5G2_11430, partial [Candidatus Krumholzibacteriia bacterium]
PEWMCSLRHQALDTFHAQPMPPHAGLLGRLDFDAFRHLVSGARQAQRSVARPGTASASTRRRFASTAAQHDSAVAFRALRERLQKRGVVLAGMDEALREHEELVRRHFATVVRHTDGKFAGLNAAVWSGGSFIYVPPDTEVEIPLQAYFGLDAGDTGRFDRTLIVADAGASVRYIEGCAAPPVRPARCTRRWWRSSRCQVRASVSRPSRTGRGT